VNITLRADGRSERVGYTMRLVSHR
jgi:hypothetical protein